MQETRGNFSSVSPRGELRGGYIHGARGSPPHQVPAHLLHTQGTVTGSRSNLPRYPPNPAWRLWLGRASTPCWAGLSPVSLIWQADYFNRGIQADTRK